MSKLELTQDAFTWFDVLPQPIWMFDPSTLGLLVVNKAACEWLGYAPDELLSKTIADLRPAKQRKALRSALADLTGASLDAGRWEIITQSGDVVQAVFHWQQAVFQGRAVVLATARDETRLKQLSDSSQDLKARASKLHAASAIAIEAFRVLFESAPVKMLALEPGTYRIIAATDAFLEATMIRREDIREQMLFDLFPDDPAEPDADGAADLKASLQRVESLKQADIMAIQRYPIRRRDGKFEERYWTTVNQPVMGPDGNVSYIVHRVEDVTELLRSGTFANLPGDMSETIRSELLSAVTTAQEMKGALSRLREQEARLRAAERLLKIGSWEYDFDTQQTLWSDRVYEIYGVPAHQRAPTIDEYVNLLHPDDREPMRQTYTEFFETGDRQVHYSHRVLGKDGSVTHVRGIGERHVTFGREIVVGLVQDITAEVEAEKELSFAQGLMRLAGEKARVGGWRVDLEEGIVYWSDETALIHESTPGYHPDLETAINFYVEEDRERITAAFSLTATEGVPSDFTAQIKTAKGNRIWVRALGEAVRNSEGRIVAVHGAFQDISDLVDAQSKAELRRQALVSTLEHIGDAFFTVDHDWRFQYLNRLGERLLGRTREELFGQNLWDAFPEAVGTAFEREYRAAVKNQTAARFRANFPPLDLWAEVYAYPVPDGLAVYFRDVGDQIRKDERLGLLETAVTRMNDILMITEAEPLDAPDGPKIIYVNEAFETHTGYAAHEVIGKTPRIMQGPETDQVELKRVSSELRKWRPVRSELVNYKKSGEPFWLELDIVPIADQTGWYTHWVAIERDVTERKRALENERKSQERFRIVSEVTNDFVWEYDPQSDTWTRNARHLHMLGLEDHQNPLSLTETLDVVHPEDRAGFERTFTDALHGNAQTWEHQYRIIDRDGHTRHVKNLAAIIRNANGVAERVVGGLTDVTKIRQLDRQVQESQKMEAIGQLTGGLAHDFNNLLTVILGNAEELSDQLMDDQQLQVLAEMTATAAERGAELTNRLLTFARRQTLEPETVDLNRLLQDMDALLRRTLPETISIKFARAGGLWKTELDPGQLEGAVLNLAINARDAMPDGGKLTIETANVTLDSDYADLLEDVQPGQYVMVSVSDTGTGMDRQTQSRIFEPFFTTKPSGAGTGLGLSMVFGFTKQSSGYIKVYSEVDEGTTIKLYFPRLLSDDEQTINEPTQEDFMGGSEHIFIVEDEEMVRKHLERQLEGLGYTVTIAENGEQALGMLEKEDVHYDLLLTDVVMPGSMNGYQLAERACDLLPDLKVLFTSGYTENAVLHQGRINNSVHLLSKPYRRQTLAQKVRDVLDES